MIQVDEKTIGPMKPADSPRESKSEECDGVVSATSGEHAAAHLLTEEQLGRLSNDQRVIDCLKKFNFTEVPVRSLAEHVGFDQNELKMLDVFWDAEFNNSWIYLSPIIVLDHLQYGSMRNFHNDVLLQMISDPNDPEKSIPRYINDVEYKEVSVSNELVCAYNLNDEVSAIRKTTPKRGVAQKYYIVKGKTFKKIVARAGKADTFRDYFLKVEELAILMRDFMVALLKYYNSQKDEEIARNRADANRLSKEQSDVINQLKGSVIIKNPTGWFYIATSKADMLKNHFKLGITENLDSRLVQYNTFSNNDTRVWYCDYWPVHDPSVIEKATKSLLNPYNLKVPGRTIRDESYYMNYDALHELVARLCAGHHNAVEYINRISSDYESIIKRPSKAVPKPPPEKLLRIEMKIATGGNALTIPLDIDSMPETEQAKVCEDIINAYVRMKTSAGDPVAATIPPVPLTWRELETFINSNVSRGSKTKVKYGAIKNVIGRISASIRSIEYRARKAHG